MKLKTFTEPTMEIMLFDQKCILSESDINGFIGDYDEFGSWLD